jgi:hypothetical protein
MEVRMMRGPIFLSVILFATSFSAYATERDKDGVPIVDIHGTIVVTTPATVSNGWHVREKRVRMITVDKKSIPLSEFMRAYCMGKIANETCSRGNAIEGIDSHLVGRKISFLRDYNDQQFMNWGLLP